MKRAYVEIREKPHYRRDAFDAGLRLRGFHVEHRLPSGPPAPGDVLVIWNRYSCAETAANTWEHHGGTVLVAENGYCGRDGNGHQLYALAIHGHNGSGIWQGTSPERWAGLGIALAPWRPDGAHVLVAPNRNFGMAGLAMPTGWEKDAVKRLRASTRRPIRVRPHPNGGAESCPLADDLANCHAVVVWASSVGVKALIAGVPVIACAPWWICKDAAGAKLEEIEAPPKPERLAVFERLAWAQWTVEEIASGVAFAHLLSDAGQGQVAQAA